MGRNSSGTNNYANVGTTPVGISTTGRKVGAKTMAKAIAKAESISKLPDREVVKQLQRGISRYEKVMGVRERKVI